MIPVTKPYLPSIKKYQHLLEGIYQRGWLTNSGPLYKELTTRLESYLGVKHLLIVTNGTLALQVALKALKLPEKSTVVTSPFTFVASPAAICWEGHKPLFSDIDIHSLNLSPKLLTQPATSQPDVIMGVHVFGNPCDVEALNVKGCKVLYDAAHAFGVQYKGQSVLNYGDASTLSFHATKLFHCVEGGAIVFKHTDDYEYAKQIVNFGLDKFGQGMPEAPGLNAKMSEFHAAMGLAMLDDIDYIIAQRKAIIEQYEAQLKGFVVIQQWSEHSENNGAYMPVILENEAQCLSVIDALNKQDVYPRRYFYPSLNTSAPYDDGSACPHSESIARRILCLPLYVGLTEVDVAFICNIIRSTV